MVVSNEYALGFRRKQVYRQALVPLRWYHIPVFGNYSAAFLEKNLMFFPKKNLLNGYFF
jgi:hypothetical protein